MKKRTKWRQERITRIMELLEKIRPDLVTIGFLIQPYVSLDWKDPEDARLIEVISLAQKMATAYRFVRKEHFCPPLSA